jgi:phenylacetate-CoA ligase
VAHRAYWNADIETMAADELAALQWSKLRRQLEWVTARSPFYQRKLADAGLRASDLRQLGDLSALPFTVKEELRQSLEASPPLGEHAAVPMTDVIRVHSSSGTTGKPSYVGITAKDRAAWTEVVSRVYWSEGVRPEDVVVHGFGLGFFVGGLPLKDAIENIGATFVPVGTGNSHRLLSSIADLRATQLTCTPSYAQYLAEYCRRELGIPAAKLGLRRVMVGAEPGGGIPAVREALEQEYHAVVTEGLGNADLIPVYAATCDERDGMHFLAPDFLLLEVIDPDSGAVLRWEDGLEGELVATHLERECVPLVRFRTRDRIVVKTSPCRCGRTGPRLFCIGRTDDMLIVAGVNVWPSAIADVIGSVRPRTTRALQILLSEQGPKVTPPLRMQIEYGVDAVDVATLKREIESRLRERLVVMVDAEMVPAGTLPRFEMKAKLVRKLYEEEARA